MSIVAIPKKITKGEELIVIPKKELEKFWQWKAEVEDALFKIRKGRKELKEGKTYKVNSPKELLSLK
ncbi:hypothetical protein KKA09_01035 [Patescibacteria group bacterium]|nr:hypothetical protein [Patescibacteria group bacterium]